jgi:hypothetical protein
MYYKRILYVDATDIERYNNGKNTYLSCSLYIQKILNVFQADIYTYISLKFDVKSLFYVRILYVRTCSL